jgi:folate-dependent phosphoribosylglycinamide formyltransferase PurN
MPPFSCYLIGETSLPASCGEILLQGGHAVLGVVSSDADVVRWARERDVPCLEPDADLTELLAREPFDHLFSVNNLRMLPAGVVSAPRVSAINFHDGPLPEYAGLNTPVWALLRGEREYGVGWHVMTTGVDEGEVLEREPVDIAADETALTLNTKCYEAAIRSRRARCAGTAPRTSSRGSCGRCSTASTRTRSAWPRRCSRTAPCSCRRSGCWASARAPSPAR